MTVRDAQGILMVAGLVLLCGTLFWALFAEERNRIAYWIIRIFISLVGTAAVALVAVAAYTLLMAARQ